MSKNKYANNERPSVASIILNILIIILLSAVILFLGLYMYTYFSGKKLDIMSLFSHDSIATEINVVTQSEPTGTITQMTVPTETTTEATTTTAESTGSEVTEITEVTEPKYTSTEYDKEFYNNTLFIGDSIFTGFSGFGYVLPENVFARVGLNPESALTQLIDEKTAIDKATEMQPERICIMLGTNGLAFLDIDYMAKDMAVLIDSLETACPDTKVILLSIPPVTKEHEADNPEKIAIIEEYNSKLKQVAEDENCMYIDIFTMLQDDEGYLAEEYAEVDGLHFLGKAYGVVLSRIEYEIKLAEGLIEPIAEETTTIEVQTETTEEEIAVTIIV